VIVADDEVVKWLIEYLSLEDPFTDNMLEENIFESGWIDSFQTIILIEELENAFSVSFTEAVFLDRRFMTVGGIAHIIGELSDG
jgi:acyl carrier protein